MWARKPENGPSLSRVNGASRQIRRKESVVPGLLRTILDWAMPRKPSWSSCLYIALLVSFVGRAAVWPWDLPPCDRRPGVHTIAYKSGSRGDKPHD